MKRKFLITAAAALLAAAGGGAGAAGGDCRRGGVQLNNRPGERYQPNLFVDRDHWW